MITDDTAHRGGKPAEFELSTAEARRLVLRAQGLRGADARRGGVPAMLHRLGAVQLDTISVLARSHELVAYARLGPIGRTRVERAYWSPRRPVAGRAYPSFEYPSFEYWAHAACILPIEEWPYFAFRRRHFARRGRNWHNVSPRTCATVLDRLRADGPLTATELGGAKRGGPWWDWSEAKIAVEFLLATGEVVCTSRVGWRRVYDLPERAVPAELLDGDTLTDEECLAHLLAAAGRSLGVATRADLADYYRITQAQVDAGIEASGLTPVEVNGWRGPAWADPIALDGDVRGRHRTTLLSPFDSLVWDRARTKRVFGFHHRLEAYVPAAKRVHGYYAMPLLHGGELVGRVDPGRTADTLLAKRVLLDRRGAVPAMATALREAAGWVGLDGVAVGRVEPATLAPALAAELAGAYAGPVPTA